MGRSAPLDASGSSFSSSLFLMTASIQFVMMRLRMSGGMACHVCIHVPVLSMLRGLRNRTKARRIWSSVGSHWPGMCAVLSRRCLIASASWQCHLVVKWSATCWSQACLSVTSVGVSSLFGGGASFRGGVLRVSRVGRVILRLSSAVVVFWSCWCTTGQWVSVSLRAGVAVRPWRFWEWCSFSPSWDFALDDVVRDISCVVGVVLLVLEVLDAFCAPPGCLMARSLVGSHVVRVVEVEGCLAARLRSWCRGWRPGCGSGLVLVARGVSAACSKQCTRPCSGSELWAGWQWAVFLGLACSKQCTRPSL